MSHVDRTNLGNAKIEGMGKDLGLVGNQYNVASTLFFIPYILFGKTTLNQNRDTHHFLTRLIRNSLKHDAEEGQPSYLAHLSGPWMGYCHDFDVSCPELFRIDCLPYISGSF